MADCPTSDVSGTPAPSDNGSSEVIFKGILTKQGKKHKTWRKRIMLLRKDHRIYYYKSIDRPPLGVIPLTDTIFSFRQGSQEDCNWPRGVDVARTITIVTEERTFYAYADTQAEAEQWIEQLAFIERSQKQKQKKATGGDGSRALKSRMKKDKLNRQRTQRFKGEEGSNEEGTDDNEISSDGSSSDLEDLDIPELSDTMMTVGVYATLEREPYDTTNGNGSQSSQLADRPPTDVADQNPADEQELYIVPEEGRNSLISKPADTSSVPEEKRLLSSPLPPPPTEATEARADTEQGIYEFVDDRLYESVNVEDGRIPDGSESPATEFKSGSQSTPAPLLLPKQPVPASNLIQQAPDSFEPEDYYASVDEGNKQRNPNPAKPITLRPPLPATEGSGKSDSFEPAESADDFYANADQENTQEQCYEEMISPEPQDAAAAVLPTSDKDKGTEDQQLYDLPCSPALQSHTLSSVLKEGSVVHTDSSGYVKMGSSSPSTPQPQSDEATPSEKTQEADTAGFQRQGSKKFTQSEDGGYKTVGRESTASEESSVMSEKSPLHDDASQIIKDPQLSKSYTVPMTSEVNKDETLSESITVEPPSEPSKETLLPKEQDSHVQGSGVTILVYEHCSEANVTATPVSPCAPDQTEHSSEQSPSTDSNQLGRNESITKRSGSFMFKQRQSKALKESAEEGTPTASSMSSLDAKMAVDIVTLEREKQQVHEEKIRLEQEWRKLENEKQKLAQEKEDFQKDLSKIASN